MTLEHNVEDSTYSMRMLLLHEFEAKSMMSVNDKLGYHTSILGL